MAATDELGVQFQESMTMADDMLPLPAFAEHYVPRERGRLYVRDFAGAGPAFVVLHGFPDNLHIYDPVIPHLVGAGRRVVALDFLGFGASDKPADSLYSFEQQVCELEAVADALALDRIIPVGHDAGVAAAVNFGLRHPARTERVVMINGFHGDAPGLRVPEIITLFSERRLSSLSGHFLRSPQQFAWLLEFQRAELAAGLSEAQKARYYDFLGTIIDENFRQMPSAAPAFARLAFQFADEVAANTARLVTLRRSDVPFQLIWGRFDPYLHVSVAEYYRAQVKNGTLRMIDAGHWPQVDEPEQVARAMLDEP